jgi:hypothetical protein
MTEPITIPVHPEGGCGEGCEYCAAIELAKTAQLAEAEGQEARAKLQRIAANNARLVRALHSARAGEAAAPEPFDPTALLEIAARSTNKTVDELRELAAQEPAPEPYVHPSVNPRTVVRRRMVAAGVPELFIRSVGDVEPIACPVLARVQQLAAAPDGQIVVLAGGLGTRKTGSACWLLGQFDGGEYVEAHELIAIKFEDRARYLRLRHAPVVVLDEIKNKPEQHDDKGHWLSIFDSLFNGWYASCARVIITCNLTAPQFKATVGDRAVDRIYERGDFFKVEGTSVRR